MIKSIIQAMTVKGYAVFLNDSKPFNINYVGVRDMGGQWNDTFYLFWKYKGNWSLVTWVGTTDPGAYYLKTPLNVKGTAILPEGQHRGLYKLGLHKGKYKALVQAREVTVYRDADKDEKPEIDGRQVKDTGYFGINSHRAHEEAEMLKIGRYSAGCLVTLNPIEYDIFINVCEKALGIWGETVTFTLLNKNDLHY